MLLYFELLSCIRSEVMYFNFFILLGMAKKLYVGNLPWGTSDETLKAALEQYGAVEDMFLKRIDGNARFAIVTFTNDEEAEAAIAGMNEQAFDAQDGRGPRNLVVNVARPKEDRPPRRDFRPRREFDRPRREFNSDSTEGSNTDEEGQEDLAA